jgi:hypothetical protein
MNLKDPNVLNLKRRKRISIVIYPNPRSPEQQAAR